MRNYFQQAIGLPGSQGPNEEVCDGIAVTNYARPTNPTEFFAKGDYFNFGTVSVDQSGETLTIGIYDETGEEEFTKTIKASEAKGGEVPTRIESTLDEDADGWLVSQNGGGTSPEYHAEDGNPGGHIGDSEGQGGVAWYYQVPFKYLGDREAFYGGRFRSTSGRCRQTSSSTPNSPKVETLHS